MTIKTPIELAQADVMHAIHNLCSEAEIANALEVLKDACFEAGYFQCKQEHQEDK